MESISKTLRDSNSVTLAEAVVAVLIEKKALAVRLYEVGEDNPVTDYYVNATGRSLTQVAALADEVAFKISEQGRDALRIEGKRGNAWILVDYGDVIVNVFDRESREFYNLDRLMPAGSEKDISYIVKRVDDKLKINSIEE
jgi:ribosome-associated protein